MNRFGAFYRSTVGKKALVAVTGLIMLGFLVAHVAGNLKVFLPDPEPGTADIDAYAAFLRTMGEPLLPHEGALWAMRAVLLVSLVVHVICVTQLVLRNRSARPIGYSRVRYKQTTLPARWMMFTGVLVLAYVIFHVMHFTTGDIDPGSFEHGAVFANLQRAFDTWPLVALYVVCMAVVSFHLYHAVWSAFQTLGLDNPDRNRGLRLVAAALAVLIFAGFVTVPVSFWAGLHDARPASVSAPHSSAEGK